MPIEPNSDGTARRASLVPVGVMLAGRFCVGDHRSDAPPGRAWRRRGGRAALDTAAGADRSGGARLPRDPVRAFDDQHDPLRPTTELVAILGPARAMAAFGCGFVLIIMAVMIDGFLVPALALRCDPPTPTCIPAILIQLSYGALQIEYLTRFALCAIAIAVLSWSVALLATPVAPRWSGVLGHDRRSVPGRGAGDDARSADSAQPAGDHGGSDRMVPHRRCPDDHQAGSVRRLARCAGRPMIRSCKSDFSLRSCVS